MVRTDREAFEVVRTDTRARRRTRTGKAEWRGRTKRRRHAGRAAWRARDDLESYLLRAICQSLLLRDVSRDITIEVCLARMQRPRPSRRRARPRTADPEDHRRADPAGAGPPGPDRAVRGAGAWRCDDRHPGRRADRRVGHHLLVPPTPAREVRVRGGGGRRHRPVPAVAADLLGMSFSPSGDTEAEIASDAVVRMFRQRQFARYESGGRRRRRPAEWREAAGRRPVPVSPHSRGAGQFSYEVHELLMRWTA